MKNLKYQFIVWVDENSDMLPWVVGAIVVIILVAACVAGLDPTQGWRRAN